VASFLTNRRAFLVINSHLGLEAPINSGLPQGLLMSSILFILYVQLLATAIETAVPDIKELSFIDDQGLIIAARLIKKA
jgi:diacylglycerol kinase